MCDQRQSHMTSGEVREAELQMVTCRILMNPQKNRERYIGGTLTNIDADLAGAVGANTPKGKGSVGACTQRKS